MCFKIRLATFIELPDPEKLEVWMMSNKFSSVKAASKFGRCPSTISKWKSGDVAIPKKVITIIKMDLDANDVFIKEE